MPDLVAAIPYILQKRGKDGGMDVLYKPMDALTKGLRKGHGLTNKHRGKDGTSILTLIESLQIPAREKFNPCQLSAYLCSSKNT